MTARRPLIDRLIEKIDFSDDCWCWTGAISGGYGTIGSGGKHGKVLKAHRAAYELAVGPIAPGLTLDHLCRNTRCVNPDHLEPVTHAENVLRGVGPTAVNAAATHCSLGHELTEANTYVYPGRGARECRICRRDYAREYARERARQRGLI